VNKFQPIFDRQKDYFNTDATKSYEWRIEQLDRMARMLNENNEAFQEAVSKDFKTALEEKVFEVAAPLATIEFTKIAIKEWMKPTSAMVPKALAASGHTAQVIREPYGVTLIIGPFNGPLILLLDPAITALSAGNPCILKLAESIPASCTLLQKLIPKYFEPDSVTAVSESREEVTELLKLPFDFHLFHRERKGRQGDHARCRRESDPGVVGTRGAKTRRLLMRPLIFLTPPGKLYGARWHGAAGGVPHPVTPMCTNPLSGSSLQSARRL
jgi:hypothetical protein